MNRFLTVALALAACAKSEPKSDPNPESSAKTETPAVTSSSATPTTPIKGTLWTARDGWQVVIPPGFENTEPGRTDRNYLKLTSPAKLSIECFYGTGEPPEDLAKDYVPPLIATAETLSVGGVQRRSVRWERKAEGTKRAAKGQSVEYRSKDYHVLCSVSGYAEDFDAASQVRTDLFERGIFVPGSGGAAEQPPNVAATGGEPGGSGGAITGIGSIPADFPVSTADAKVTFHNIQEHEATLMLERAGEPKTLMDLYEDQLEKNGFPMTRTRKCDHRDGYGIVCESEGESARGKVTLTVQKYDNEAVNKIGVVWQKPRPK